METAVLTAGGTREPIDEVRHVANVATGRLPAALGNALLRRGWAVHYVHGPGALLPGVVRAELRVAGVDAGTLERSLEAAAARARELHAACRGSLHLHAIQSAADAADILPRTVAGVRPRLVACAMAVADYAPEPTAGKLDSGRPELIVRMRPTAKTIDLVRAAYGAATILGFKLLCGATEAEQRAACLQLARRADADLVFCNDILDYRAGLRRGRLFDRHGRVLAEIDGGSRVDRLAEALVHGVLQEQRTASGE